ncbi:MAG TPA: MBG domain-containing protein, partial [Pirellulales bacterium]|nr:MBG domain-containing protein [Pirellulales bacterium]
RAASLSTPATLTSGVGNYSVTAGLGTLSATNYTFALVDGTLSITPATLTVTADDKTKAYGQDNPPLTDSITGLVNGDPANVVSGAASLSTPATLASGVGNYSVTAGLGTLSATNYTFTLVDGTLTISPATLTVTADDKTKVFGSANPPLTDTITGFVNGDTSNVVSGAASLNTTATSTSTVGNYAITVSPGTLSAGNYVYVFVPGTLAVTESTAQETLSGAGLAANGFELSPLVNIPVATFVSSSASEPGSAFTATIHWGDGASSPGTVSPFGGPFTVTGSHTYSDEGSFAVTIDVADSAASTTIVAIAAIQEELLREGTPGSADQRYISEIYRDVLGRQAEPQGRDFWVSHLERGDSRAKVVQDILAAMSEEYHLELINADFNRYLQRAPDPAAMQYFTGLLDSGGDAGRLDAILVSSPEYFRLHGGTLDGFADALFRDALNRPVDPAALSAMNSRAAQGATRAQMADVVFSSEEYRRDLVGAWYQRYLDRTADAAGLATYTAQLDAGAPAEHVIAALLSAGEFVGKI